MNGTKGIFMDWEFDWNHSRLIDSIARSLAIRFQYTGYVVETNETTTEESVNIRPLNGSYNVVRVWPHVKLRNMDIQVLASLLERLKEKGIDLPPDKDVKPGRYQNYRVLRVDSLDDATRILQAIADELVDDPIGSWPKEMYSTKNERNV